MRSAFASVAWSSVSGIHVKSKENFDVSVETVSTSRLVGYGVECARLHFI